MVLISSCAGWTQLPVWLRPYLTANFGFEQSTDGKVLHTCLQVNSQCAYTVGVDGNTWGNGTKQIWNMTFEQYLSAETGCTFPMTLFTSPDQFVSSGLDGSVDFFFAGPGVFVCLQVMPVST